MGRLKLRCLRFFTLNVAISYLTFALVNMTDLRAMPKLAPCSGCKRSSSLVLAAGGGQGNQSKGQGQNGHGNQGPSQGNQGNGNGQNGQGGAQGNKGNGQGQGGQGNGNGDNGNGKGKGGPEHSGGPDGPDPGPKGKKTGQLQGVQGAVSGVQQVTGYLDRDLESRTTGARAAALGSAAQYDLNSNLSVFTISGASWTHHDGFKTTSAFGETRGPSFDILNYGFTGGVRYDASAAFGLTSNAVTFGAFGNYTHSSIKLAETPFDLAAVGFSNKAEIDSVAGGAFALATFERFYLFGITAYSSGAPDFLQTNTSNGGAMTGFVTSGSIGTVQSLWERVSADFRASLSYSQSSTGNCVDPTGLTISDGKLEDLSGAVSVKVFTVRRAGNWTLRPFVQGGINYQLGYTNVSVWRGPPCAEG